MVYDDIATDVLAFVHIYSTIKDTGNERRIPSDDLTQLVVSNLFRLSDGASENILQSILFCNYSTDVLNTADINYGTTQKKENSKLYQQLVLLRVHLIAKYGNDYITLEKRLLIESDNYSRFNILNSIRNWFTKNTSEYSYILGIMLLVRDVLVHEFPKIGLKRS
jgi:hypothetical protein